MGKKHEEEMSRRHNVNDIDLKVTNVWFGERLMLINWESNIGFGEYCIEWEMDYNSSSQLLFADSECMDSNEDKDFLKLLLEKAFEWIIERIDIRG